MRSVKAREGEPRLVTRRHLVRLRLAVDCALLEAWQPPEINPSLLPEMCPRDGRGRTAMAVVRIHPSVGYTSIFPTRGRGDEKLCPTMPCGRSRAGEPALALKLTSSRWRGPRSRPKTGLPLPTMVQLRTLNFACEYPTTTDSSSHRFAPSTPRWKPRPPHEPLTIRHP